MSSLSPLFAAPAVVFLFIAALWYIGRGVPRLLAVLPVAACYAMCAALLLMGGWFHRMAHVTMHGMRLDLTAASGKPREVPIGGALAGDRAEAGLEVPGLPPDSLRLTWENAKLRVLPGPGYERGILVRSGGRMVPLEPGGVPALLPLSGGDRIKIPTTEGGEVVAQWRIGKGRYELDATAAQRWIGSDGTGAARVTALPAQVLGFRVAGDELILTKGPGMSAELGAAVNGVRVSFASGTEARLPFQSGRTRLAVMKPEPAAGVLSLVEAAPLRHEASLDWERAGAAQPLAFSFELEAGRAHRLGGSLQDDVFIKGLPPGALLASISDEGKLSIELSKDGKEALEKGELRGDYPQTCQAGKHIRIGADGSPASGTLHLIEAIAETPAAPSPSATTATVTSADPSNSAGPVGPLPEGTSRGEGDVDAPSATVAPPKKWKCAWRPAVKTRWQLPNRAVSMPLFDVPMELFTRRPWVQRVFGLNQLSAREGSIRSALVYGPPHPAWVNGVSLLQLEPGIIVERDGAALARPQPVAGLIDPGQTLEFLQVLTDVEGGDTGSSLGHPLHPAAVTTLQRVSVRKRFAFVKVEMEQRGKREAPVLVVGLERPVVRSVPMSEVKKDLAAQDDETVKGVRFGINDRGGFSDLPHQVTFPGITKWFDHANADVEMNWLDVTVQDDFKRQTIDFGEPFHIGGSDRLELSIKKETVPMWRIFWVIAAGMLAIALVWQHARQFWWVALFFGVAFLTCARVLFGQAVLVNAPYNAEVIATAMKALPLAPLVLGVGGFLLRHLLPGRIESRLQGFEQRFGYGWLCVAAFALLVLRALLLLGGAKEALALGGARLALSIVFVPMYLLLFAQACQVMWAQKEEAGGLLPGVVIRFVLCTLWLFGCQALTAMLVSDLGMFLYFVPMALVLAAIGVGATWDGTVRSLRVSKEELKRDKPWRSAVAGLCAILPIVLMAALFTAPKSVIGLWPGLLDELASDEELVTDSTLLRVLQFADEDYLINLGTDTAERIAQDHAIMANYAHRGLLGEGWLQVNVLPAKYVTALNDNVSAVFIFAQFGVLGAIAVVVAYLAVLLGSVGGREPVNALTSWLALLAGLSFALVSIYMMASNYGLLPFTGRNMYLLGLNSSGDVLESFILLLLIVLGMARAEFREALLFSPSNESADPARADLVTGNTGGVLKSIIK